GPVLMALNAGVKMATKEKERTLTLDEFFVDFFETALDEGELLLEVQVPVVPPRTAVVYEKFNIIKNDQGIVSVAVSMTAEKNGTRCKSARIVLGAAASKPLRAKEAEAMLEGKRLEKTLLDQVGQKASDEADPVTDIHASDTYRRHLVKALTKKMVKKAWERAGKSAL
ncbi:MAG: FAD binding domain-containing protein, partial [Candidatus Aminicenantes bacterium]